MNDTLKEFLLLPETSTDPEQPPKPKKEKKEKKNSPLPKRTKTLVLYNKKTRSNSAQKKDLNSSLLDVSTTVDGFRF